MDHVDFANIASFAILVNHSRDVSLDHLHVEDSGSLNALHRNNTTGGVLLEEGTDSFTVADSVFENIRGNAVWTHSRYRSPRNRGGKIRNVKFSDIGRDAIQIGHAVDVEVSGNRGRRIGFPSAIVDVEGGGTPVAIDTAGNVESSTYEYNQFEEINGKCIDLDGFHDGAVRGNTCINRGKPDEYPFGHFGIVFNNANPDMQSRNILVESNELDGMKFGGIFLIGIRPSHSAQSPAAHRTPRTATKTARNSAAPHWASRKCSKPESIWAAMPSAPPPPPATSSKAIPSAAGK